MPLITSIMESKRQPSRRRVFLDGRFAFACHENVIARFRLREGMSLDEEEVSRIEQGQVRQECLDHALRHLQRRLHSRAELRRKLIRQEYAAEVVDGVLDELERLGYVDDLRFARTRAAGHAEQKGHGRRRAMMELLKAGVTGAVAERAVGETYDQVDPSRLALEVAAKHVNRLRRLDPQTARRRLAGLLQRRGFEFDSVRAAIEQVLGRPGDAAEDA
jgi:regulatory protein